MRRTLALAGAFLAVVLATTTLFAAPSITSLSPTSGPSGTSVTVSGSGFGNTKGTSTITFGGVVASTASWGNKSITAIVPSGLSNGAVNVIVQVSGVNSNSKTFTIANPIAIQNLNPTSGPSGTVVTITGTAFGSPQGGSTVKFGSAVASVNSWADTTIQAIVPNGIVAGTVGVVVTVNNTASNTVNFPVTNPLITSISVNSVLMNSAPENQLITITGSGFGATQGTSSSVTFNGLTGVPSSWSDTAISVPVPQGATTGNIVVSANGNPSPGYPFMVTPASQSPGVHFIQGDYFARDTVPSSAIVPFPIAQTAGNLNVVVVGWRGAYNISVTDTANNAYVLAVGPTTFSSWTQSIYYAKNISGATSNTVTVTFTQRTQQPLTQIAADVRIAEYSGLNTTSPLDVVAAAGGTSTTADSGYATTTNQNDLLVGAGMADGVISGAGSNYTLRVIPINANHNNSDILEDRVVTSTGSYDATAALPASKSFLMQMVALKEAANQAPVVNAGSNQTITLPTTTTTLQGTATDDGLPNNTLTISWTQVSGPGTASFNAPNQAITDATFPVAGTYVLQLTANDSQLGSSSTVTVTVNPAAQPPIVNAGPNQTITFPQNAVNLNGSVTGNNISAIGWTIASGPAGANFFSPSNPVTSAAFSQPGVYVLRLSATNPQGTSNSTATITVNPPVGTPASGSIVLSPKSIGPVTVGTNQQVQATVVDGGGAPIANVTMTFTVNGANPRSSQSVTNASGITTFSYAGASAGVDSIVGTATIGSLPLTSNPSMISWVSVAPQISSSSVLGQFFVSDGSGTFDTPANAQPAFTQTFSAIDFNPPAGSVPGAPSSIDVTTRPFTNVITDVNGNYSSSVIAQGNGVQAGSGQLTAFQAVFTGTLTVGAAGNVTFDFLNADGFVFGVGGGASRVSGTYVRAPSSTAFNGYPVMGAFDDVTFPAASSITVHFPGAGSYPYEIDYAASNKLPLVPRTWKYSLNNPPSFQLLGFDDSSWPIGSAPFTSSPGSLECNFLGNTLFPVGGTLDVRKVINLPAGASNITASVAIDNDFTLWINGTLVVNQTHEFCANYWDYTVPIPDSLWQPGANLIAVQARDRGSVATFDFQLTGAASSLPSIPKQMTLSMKTAPTVGQGGVTLSPSSALSNTIGQSVTFTAFVTDASGAVLSNTPVTFIVAGANAQQFQTTTDVTGTAVFTYQGFFAGSDIVQAQAQPAGNPTLVSSQTSVSWSYFTSPPPTGALTITPTNPPNISVGQMQTFTVHALDALGNPAANVTVTLLVSLANTLQLTATTDSTGTATFSYVGANSGGDTVQAEAVVGNTLEFTSLVSLTWTNSGGGTGGGSCSCVNQGWIGLPINGSGIKGQVPITVASGVSLSSGTLTYWPTANPSAVTTLNSNTTGSGTLGIFDATLLANGGYTIQLSATANGTTQVSQISVNVIGDYKPGRITTTVTEFKVPLAGIPISITRTYDSLERNLSEDFGNGWKLGTTVGLTVDSKFNVTLNFNGQRETFYFVPQPSSFWFAWLLNAQYVPQPGFHGTLISDGCSGLINVSGTLHCFGAGLYQPTVYQYTDPSGRAYTITASGQLQAIKDLNGNTITVTPNGIISSVGSANVTFTRDGTGRITDIYDLNHSDYHYSYDGNGDLHSVQYPALTSPDVYTYYTAQDCPTTLTCLHVLKTEQDPRGNTSTAVYYDSTNDGGNTLLDGRLKSVTGPSVPDPSGNPGNVQFTTDYSYNLSTNTSTIINPIDGSGNRQTVTRTDDSFGNPLTITEQVNGSTSRTKTYQYDSKENLTQITDPLGNRTLYTYDANGFQTSMQAPGLPADSKTYNQFGGITSQTDAANTNTITTTYDSNFNPISVTDKLNGTGGSPVATYSNYDAMGNFADSADANGKATHFDYYQTGPQTGYLQDVIRNNGIEKTSYTYDAMGKVLTMADACGNGSCSDMTVGTSHATTYTYDQLERVSTMTDAAGFVTKYLYDNNGNKTDQYDAFGTSLQRHTVYQYDNLNRLTQITYPDLTTKQLVYDFRGNKTVETDQLGHKTAYAYDLAGQLTSVTYADGGTVTYTYDLDGRKQTVTDETNQSTGLHTTNTYDPAGRLISVQDALSNLTSYGYDADGRRTSVTEPNNQAAQLSTTYAYDPRGRLQTITYPATQTQPATSMQYTYDGMGRALTSQDQNGKITTKTYDDVGRLTSVKDAITPTGNTTTYQYDLNGNLKTLIDANSHTTQCQYDTLNRRAHRTLPLGQVEDYSYDALGRLATKTDFNRKTTTYNYDSIDRLLSKVPDPTLSQATNSFTYTATGQRLSMIDPSGTTNYSSYDNRDRLLTKSTPEGTLTYTYDAHGNVLTINSSNANGASMTYTYDALNRLASAKDNRVAAQGGSSNPTTYSYDNTGNLTNYLYPNTVQTQNAFDPLNRLTQTCSATSTPACSAGTKLSSYLYGLGTAGNRLTVTELNNRQVLYGYDNDYRLTSEAISADPAGNNGTVSYPAQPTGYDAVGNRLAMTSTLNAVPGGSFSYDANDRLTTEIYDANGNTISSAGITNTYDFENRMTGHGSLTLLYDGDGNRVAETVGGTTTKFLIDDKNLTGYPQVLEELVNASVTRTYVYGLQRISENQQISGNWTPSFYGYDGHGNVRFLTNSAGAITDTYTYDAFGMQIARTGTTPNVFQYSGEWLDSSVGLYYLRARYFNQATGRFWSMDCCEGDIEDPPTLNKYVYAENNPVSLIDPTGRGALAEYSITIQNRVFSIAVHPATHYWTVLGVKFYCVHLQLLTYLMGISGSAARVQIPLPPLCWTTWNWF